MRLGQRSNKASKIKHLISKQARNFAFALLLSVLFVGVGFEAGAGECKVQNPDDLTRFDALRMARQSEETLNTLAQRYRRAAGEQMQVVIIARAGQDLSDQIVLDDVADGRVMSLGEMVEVATKTATQQPRPNVGEVGQAALTDVEIKPVLRTLFADPKRKLTYSHVGFMIYKHPMAKEGFDWWGRHMLRPCDNPEAKTEVELMLQSNLNKPYIWNEGPGNFFADDPHELRAQYFVPPPAVQKRLMEILADKKLQYDLNSDFYNAAASWLSLAENNSNQWVIEILAAAMQPKGHIENRKQAQAHLSMTGYRPSKVLFYGMKTLAAIPFASKLKPFLRYHAEEQPFYFRFGLGELISVNSLEDYMERQGLMFLKAELIGPEKAVDELKRFKKQKR